MNSRRLRAHVHQQVRVLGDGTHRDRRGHGIAEGDAIPDVTDARKDCVVRRKLHRGRQTGSEASLHRGW